MFICALLNVNKLSDRGLENDLWRDVPSRCWVPWTQKVVESKIRNCLPCYLKYSLKYLSPKNGESVLQKLHSLGPTNFRAKKLFVKTVDLKKSRCLEYTLPIHHTEGHNLQHKFKIKFVKNSFLFNNWKLSHNKPINFLYLKQAIWIKNTKTHGSQNEICDHVANYYENWLHKLAGHSKGLE